MEGEKKLNRIQWVVRRGKEEERVSEVRVRWSER